MAKVLVKLINTHYQGAIGEVIRAFGHDFIIQPNGDAIANVDEGFVAGEVKAGRYVVVEPNKVSENSAELSEFGRSIGNYYGAGDLEKLRKRIEKLRKEALVTFAETRLNVVFPQSASKTKMIAEIMNSVAHNAGQTEQDEKVEKKDE